MSKKCAERGGFKLIKLGRPIVVRNVDGTGNSGGSITHEVEVNLYFKGHVCHESPSVSKSIFIFFSFYFLLIM